MARFALMNEIQVSEDSVDPPRSSPREFRIPKSRRNIHACRRWKAPSLVSASIGLAIVGRIRYSTAWMIGTGITTHLL